MVPRRFVQLLSNCCVLFIYLNFSAALGAQTKNPQGTPASKALSPQLGSAAAASTHNTAGTQEAVQVPMLPPIVHDFTSLLEPPAKNASPTQLKSIVALVFSDKSHAYLATIKTLAPDYVIVTNPVPSDETAVSVLVGSTAGGKPSVSAEFSFSEVTKNVVITGDFSTVTKVPVVMECGESRACAVLLAADGETVIGRVTALEASPVQLSVTYTVAPTATPESIRIQDAASHYPIFRIGPSKASAAQNQTVQFRQVIAADFCQKNENGDCTTDFSKPMHPSRPGYPDDPHFSADPKILVTGKYVLDAGDSSFQPAQLNALGSDTADISFSAPPSFKPAYLVLATASQSYRFSYTPAPPLNTSDLNYESSELGAVCDQMQNPSYPTDKTKTIPDCDHTPPERLSLKSLTSGNGLGYVAMQGNLIVARVTSPLGQEANAIVVSNNITKKSTVARRAIKPGGDSNILNVDMTIMDQTTTQRNYGNRIAKRYIAVTLDVKNPTPKKVQFNKSAMYFDVDYVEAREQGLTETGFVHSIGEVSTLGLYQPSVYQPPFLEGRKLKDCEKGRKGCKKNSSINESPRIARFGLEQNEKQSPENFLSMLGSFDYTTTMTDNKLKAVELIGSLLTNIAAGGVVADASGAFRAGTSIFSGTFLPGVRGIVLDTSYINRLRSNMVAQTLQDTIQVPAKGSTTTIVFLPRTGILGFTDAEVPVIVKRVIDVHLVEEVVSDVTETPVKKNACTVGNTKDQTRQSLGEPSGLTPNPDGGSSFTYSMGPVATVLFDKSGNVVSCGKPRTSAEQMDVVKTLVEAKQTLTDLGISATQITLTDSSVIIADIPGVSITYHFDSKGSIAPEYTFLFKEISTEANKANETQAQFEAFLEGKATSLSATRTSEIKAQASKAGNAKPGSSVTYGSPDIQNGSITVNYKKSGAGKSALLVVDQITFQGDKPKGVD